MFPEQELNLPRDFRYGLTVGLNAECRSTVVDLSFFVELSKTLRVGGEWPGVIFADSALQFIQWSIEKDNGSGAFFKKVAILSLCKGTATQGHDRRVAIRQRGEQATQGFGLQLPKAFFPGVLEDIGDSVTGTGLDLAIEIDEAPTETLAEVAPHGRLASSHEADQKDCTSLSVRTSARCF